MNAVREYIRVIVEKRCQKWGENDHRSHKDESSGNRKKKSNVCSFSGPFHVVSPKVLSYKGGDCQTDTLDRQQTELVQFPISGPACHAGRTKMVDIRLYKYIGKRGDGDLKARRKANAKDRHDSSFVDMQVFPYQMV